MSAISRAFSLYSNKGVQALSKRFLWHTNRIAWKAYDRTFRKLMPATGLVRYAGIPISRRKLFDGLFPQLFEPPVNDIPDYEAALVSALKSHVRETDSVVVVGGGHGVTCIIAAILAPNGRVECFEGDLFGIRRMREAAELNGVSDKIIAHHAIVGASIGVWDNDVASSTIIAPKDLPPCDILEMDCEGAEILILQQMTIQPRVIAVETHGVLGAPTEKVREVLVSRGYQVEDLGWAEPRHMADCAKDDIRVLVGTIS